jgi:phosphate starvation-inducible PhoH-like protein
MTEKTIILEDIDPIDFWGVNNANYKSVVARFPKMRIVARGNEIKVLGEVGEIDTFENKLYQLAEYYGKYRKVNEEVIDSIYGDGPILDDPEISDVLVYGNYGNIIKARTPSQKKIVELSKSNDLLFATGPAGSGKTYTAIALAVRALKNKEVKKIILTRPAIEAGERLGFLPGDMKDKLDPYLQPLYDALNDMIPAKKLQGYMEEGIVQIAPLAYMRGRTLDHAFVILDEAQNTTLPQIKMFLTRMGKNAKFIVTGDVTQIDLPRKSDSGLEKSLFILKGIKGIGIVEFNKSDIIRHKLVSKIVSAFEKKEDTQSIE